MHLKQLLNLAFKKYVQTTLILSSFFFLFLISASPIYAVTRYVNADSDGTASNPTRAFDHPSYTANDSYQTLTAAYGAASAGDVLEFSGGTTSKSYLGMTFSMQRANLTVRGSTIANHNGEVIINYNSGGGTYTMGLNANGMTLDRITVSREGGTNTQYGLRVFLDDATIRNVTIKNTTGFGVSVEATADNTLFENFRMDTSTIAGANALQGFNGFTMRNAILSGMDLTGIGGISFQSSATAYTLDNVVFDGISSGSVLPTSGATVNLTNCVITGSGFNTQRAIYGTGGTVNTTNCFLQGPLKIPDVIAEGGVTWNSSNDITGQYSYYTRTKENLGYIMIGIDDRHNVDHFKAIADYAKTNYGMTMSFYVHDTGNLSSDNKTKMQQLYLDGHEIALHSRDHTNMGVAGPMSITYTGAASNIAFVVSSSGTSLSLTGSADTQGPIDLTAAANDTVGELCTTIEAWTNYTCTLTGTVDAPTRTFVPSITLKDASMSLPQNSARIPLYDDNTGPSNRFLTREVTTAITELEAAMHENPATSGYQTKTFAYPYSQKTTAITDWIRTNTDLISVRAVGTDTLATRSWLGNINVFFISNAYSTDNIRGTGYDSLNAAQKEARVKEAARAMVTYASLGMVTGYVGHNESQDLSLEELEWLVDEIAVYDDVANVQLITQEDIVEEIIDSGDWSDGGSGAWTRTFSGSADYRPRYQSQMINAGITVSGRSSDIAGNPLVGNPDMGAYEFQAPASPTSLAQYKSDGSTTIVSAAWTNETTVVLKFLMSSVNVVDQLTPEVEVRTNATAFTDAVTHSGTAVDFTGTPVLGTVTVTGLSTNTQYHWQARASNEASGGTWTSMGGNPDFGVDTTAPVTNDSGISASWVTSAPVAVSLNCTDTSGSGCATTYHTTDGTTPTTGSTTGSSFNISVDGTYTIKYFSVDNVGNQESVKTAANQVRLDTTAPTVPGTPSTVTPTNQTTPTWSWPASTDATSGLANPAYSVQWSTASDFSVVTGSGTSNTNSFLHSIPLADGTWYFRVRATDVAGNNSSYSSNGSVVIDTDGPVISNIDATPGTTTAEITWDTDEVSSSQVNYGLTISYGSTTVLEDTAPRVTSHSVDLSGLSACTEYHYRVRSIDAASNESVSTDNTFTTTGCPSPVPSPSPSPAPSVSPSPSPSPDPSPTPSSETSDTSTTHNFGPVANNAKPPQCNANPPSSAPSVSITSYGTNSVRLRWNSIDPVTHYGVYFRRNSDGAEYGATNIGNVSTYTIDNLNGQSSYTFEVFGINDCAPGPRGQVVSRVIRGGSVALAPLGVAEDAPAEVASTSGEAYPLKIKVADADDQPVVGVNVDIPTASASATTDNRGTAAFNSIPAGPQQIEVAFNGETIRKDVNVDESTAKSTVVVKVAEDEKEAELAETGTTLPIALVAGVMTTVTVGGAALYLFMRKSGTTPQP
jgi:hypothetical protein